MALVLASDYITQARTLLQDLVQPYRYPDATLLEALNNCWLEVTRVRPDIVLNARYSTSSKASDQTVNLDGLVFIGANMGATVPMPVQYQMSVVYYMIGFAQLQDNEDVQDSRAASLLTKFTAQLLGVQA